MGAGASSGAQGYSSSGALPLKARDGLKEEVAELLAQKGINVNANEKDTGNTALHYASAIGHVSTC